jgi:hypothetical protein
MLLRKLRSKHVSTSFKSRFHGQMLTTTDHESQWSQARGGNRSPECKLSTRDAALQYKPDEDWRGTIDHRQSDEILMRVARR